jgi:cis-3-alkyl-4-acyloxetan-2-one decarboxylase
MVNDVDGPGERYPFKSNYLDIDGLKYHYLDEGNGEPVVMVHGNPTWSYYYRNLVLSLRDSYRTIVPDHIGCGYSDKPDDSRYNYTLDSRVNDLERLLDHLGITENITLVLHDWGGMIGMAYASRHPHRIKRFVIMNTSCTHLPKEKSLPWQLKLFRSCLGGFLIRGLNMFSEGAVHTCCMKKKMPREVQKGFLSPYNSWKNRIAVLRFVQDIPIKSGDIAYKTVSEVENGLDRFKKLPMLIIWGEKDFVFDNDFRDVWIKHFPEAEVHSYPDAGHYILEDADDEVIPVIKKFLEKHPVRE